MARLVTRVRYNVMCTYKVCVVKLMGSTNSAAPGVRNASLWKDLGYTMKRLCSSTAKTNFLNYLENLRVRKKGI
jgi:hypothetical protein